MHVLEEPLISVLLPVYNAEEFVKEAVDSILCQTFTNFELLVLNDGSTDNSMELVTHFKDKRIRIINNDGNKGLIYTLNKGIQEAKGEYIARMDADDIALPNRFERQIKYLQKHKEISILGSNVETFGNEAKITNYPINDEEIKLHMLFENPLCHPTVMFRKSIFLENNLSFNSKALHMEDWWLWFDAAQKNMRFHNLEDVTLRYRYENQNITIKNKATSKARYMEFYENVLNHIFSHEATPEEIEMHWMFSRGGIKKEHQTSFKLYISHLKEGLNSKFNSNSIETFITSKLEQLIYRTSDQDIKTALWIQKSFGIKTTGNYLLKRRIKNIIGKK